eukprot:GHVT01070987.1.p1 GENE.GHVT01070987.1~~GHVT01070987.1.p1  ORF type:complete len:821 (-),score=111.62 GHVT01070987.1:15-2477(-)
MESPQDEECVDVQRLGGQSPCIPASSNGASLGPTKPLNFGGNHLPVHSTVCFESPSGITTAAAAGEEKEDDCSNVSEATGLLNGIQPDSSQLSASPRTVWTSPPTRIPGWVVLAYAAPSVGMGAINFTLTTFAAQYYTDTLHVSPRVVGLVQVLLMVVYAVCEPLFGLLSDSVTGRLVRAFGRRKPFLVTGCIIESASFYMLMCPPLALRGEFLVHWALICTVCLGISWGCFEVVYQGLGSQLTFDYEERTRLQAVVVTALTSGSTTCGLLYGFLGSVYGSDRSADLRKFWVIAAIFSTLFMLGTLFMLYVVHENAGLDSRPRPIYPSKKSQTTVPSKESADKSPDNLYRAVRSQVDGAGTAHLRRSGPSNDCSSTRQLPVDSEAAPALVVAHSESKYSSQLTTPRSRSPSPSSVATSTTEHTVGSLPRRRGMLCRGLAIIWAEARELFTNWPSNILMLTYACALTAGAVTPSLLPYFCKHIAHSEFALNWAPVFVTSAAVVGMPLWVFLGSPTVGLDKKTRLLLSAVWISAGMAAVAITIGPGQTVQMVILCTFVGFAMGGYFATPEAMKPDVVDYDEFRTGKRHEARYMGTYMFAANIMAGCSLHAAMAVLSSTGYDGRRPAGDQPPAALLSIRLLFGGPICVMGVIMGVALMFYPITKHRHLEILKATHNRLNGLYAIDPLYGGAPLPPYRKRRTKNRRAASDHAEKTQQQLSAKPEDQQAPRSIKDGARRTAEGAQDQQLHQRDVLMVNGAIAEPGTVEGDAWDAENLAEESDEQAAANEAMIISQSEEGVNAGWQWTREVSVIAGRHGTSVTQIP